MMRITTIVALGCLLGGGLAEANTHVPTNSEDVWDYQRDLGGDQTMDVINHSGNWHLFRNFAGWQQQWVYVRDGSERIYLWREGAYYMLADLAAPTGTRFEFGMPGCNAGETAIGARDESVEVPAGTFDGVIRVDLTVSCTDAGRTSIWFAPGVGIVKWAETMLAGPNVAELKTASVGGVDYPLPVDHPLKVEFGADKYFIGLGRMSGRNPPVVQSRLKVSNQAAREVDFLFSDGQTFEILAENSNGDIVARWSDGRFFTQATRRITLSPGETLEFEGALELPPHEGVLTLRMFLVADHRPGGQAPLKLVAVE